MPITGVFSPADRVGGTLNNMHPRSSGDLINTPDDLLEGFGNFTHFALSGNPISPRNPEITAEMVSPPVADAHGVLAAYDDPNATTVQNTSPIELEKPSYPLNKPIINGDPMPVVGDYVAPLPTPDPPTVAKAPPTVMGYPQSTAQSPYWLAWAWGDKKHNYTMLSPKTSMQISQGQSIHIPLPDLAKPPVGASYIGIFLSEPGQSTVATAGPMRLQREVTLANYSANFYEMQGPYVFGRLAPTTDETSVGVPPAPSLRSNGHDVAKIGTAVARITWVDANGEGLPSPVSNSVTINGSGKIPNDPIAYQQQVRQNQIQYQQALAQYRQQQSSAGSGGSTGTPPQPPQDPLLTQGDPTAGYGSYTINRGHAPPEATGWYAYLTISGSESRIYNQRTDEGRSKPFSLSISQVGTQGWQATDAYGLHNTYVLGGGSPPTTDGSAVASADAAPQQPTAFGAARPGPGTIWVRQIDYLEGLPSLPSGPVSVTIGDYDVPRIIFSNPANKLVNGLYVEKGADGLPLDWTITQAGGSASVDSAELVLTTSGPQVGATPTAASTAILIDKTLVWDFGATIIVQNPDSGAYSGSAQVILQEFSATGAVTQTVLATLSQPGEYRIRQLIGPGQSLTWQTTTVTANLLFQFLGASPKNAKARISRGHKKPFKHRRRRHKHRHHGGGGGGGQPPPDPNPPPEVPGLPGTDGGILPPAQPPSGPETFPLDVTQFDRPLSNGVVFETDNFDSGLPSGWTAVTSNATCATSAAAAISGAQGLRCQKSSSGAGAQGYITKTFSPETGLTARHALAIKTRNQVAALGVNDYVEMHRLVSPADGSKRAFIRYGNALDVEQLTITDQPLYPGNVTLQTDSGAAVTQTSVAVGATQEVATITVNTAPTSPGTVTISLDNGSGILYPFIVPVGGTRQQFTLSVTQRPAANGYLTVTVGGVAYQVHVGRRYSTQDMANAIARTQYQGWTVTQSGANVFFTSDLAGTRSTPTFSAGTTASAATITVTQAGTTDTAAQLADRIRTWDFSPVNWQGGGTAGSTTVTLTSTVAGPRLDATFAPGNVTFAGAAPSIVATTQGTIDSPADLAARIRGTAFPGYTLSGTGANVIFTATAAGRRQPAAYVSGSTGAHGTFSVTRPGLSGDITAHVIDANGVEQKRRIMTGLTTSSIWDIDVAIVGAAVTDSSGNSMMQAIVSFWGFIEGAGSRQLLARFESLDMTGFPAGIAQVGVGADSSTSATWDVHVDDLSVTDRGLTYYRDHDYSGFLLSQLYYSGVPSQPVGAWGLKGLKFAVIPGITYTARVWALWDNVPSGTSPLLLTVYNTAQTPTHLADITGGLSGSGGWQEFTYTFVPPNNCFEASIEASPTVSSGLIVFQELHVGVGNATATANKRTPLYQASGAYTATLSLTTPSRLPPYYWGRQRRSMTLDTDTPTGTTVTATYQAADSLTSGFDAPVTDPSQAVDRNLMKVTINTSSNLVATPVIKSGSPFGEYQLLVGNQVMATLLKEDGTELDGGTQFVDIQRWSHEDDYVTNVLPGGRFRNISIFPGSGHLPPADVRLFNPDAKQYLENNIRKKLWRIEAWGERYTVRFGGPVQLVRKNNENQLGGAYFGIYEGKLPPGEIVDRQALP